MNLKILDLETCEIETIYVFKHIPRVGDRINLKTKTGLHKNGIVRNVVWDFGNHIEDITLYVKFNEPIDYLTLNK